MSTALDQSERLIDDPTVLHRMPMVVLLLAACTGILVDRGIHSGAIGSIALSLAGVAAVALFFRVRSARVVRWQLPFVFALTIIGFGCRHRVDENHFGHASIVQFLSNRGQPTIIEGRIASRPELRRSVGFPPSAGTPDWLTSFDLDLNSIRVREESEPVTGRLRVLIDGDHSSLIIGQVAKVTGIIQGSQQPSNPGSLDMRGWLRAAGVHGYIDAQSLSTFDDASNDRVGFWNRVTQRAWQKSRQGLLQSVDPDGSVGPLALALVLGERQQVDRQTRDKLIATGTAHLLSVSGMHLAIVVSLASMLAIFVGLPWRVRLLLMFGVCIGYAAITGGRPPVIRAAILVLVFLLSLTTKRTTHPLNTLAFAGLVLLVWQPQNLFNVGVQLSFLAVGTLLIASGFSLGQPLARPVADAIKAETQLEMLIKESQPRWRSLLSFLVKRLRDLLKLSFYVTLVSTPLVWHSFNVVTPIAILMNVVLAPLLMLALGSGVLTIFAASLGPAAGEIPGTVCRFTLNLMTNLIEIGASLPRGHFWLPSPPGEWVACFYIGLLVWLLLGCRRKSKLSSFRLLVAVIGWFVVAWVGAVGAHSFSKDSLDDETVEALFVDVGHGTAVVIRSGAETWLYDCGQMGNEDFRPRGIDQVLWSMGITKINGVVLSHADADHFNALPGLLERFSIDGIYTPPAMLEDDEPAVRKLAGIVASEGIAVKTLASGDQLDLGAGLTAFVLHPSRNASFDSDNAGSLVLQLSKANRTILLPGDLEPPGTQQLLEHPRPPIGGILMAPHHGSLRADSEMVLQWARPRFVVISGGRLTYRQEVLQTFAATGADVYRTVKEGAVRVRISASGEVEVRGFLREPW